MQKRSIPFPIFIVDYLLWWPLLQGGKSRRATAISKIDNLSNLAVEHRIEVFWTVGTSNSPWCCPAVQSKL